MAQEFEVITVENIETLVNAVNKTLQKYQIKTIPNISRNTSITPNLILQLTDSLKTADNHRKNKYQGSQSNNLTNSQVKIGDYIKASTYTNISSYSNKIYNNYCSCNCNNCCSCHCNNCCSCNSQVRHPCGIDAQHTCFAPETIIFTSKGPRKVQDLNIGDFILTPNGNYDEIISCWTLSVKNQKMIKYYNNLSSIILTDNHCIPIEQDKFCYPQLFKNSSQNKLFFRNNISYPDNFIKNTIYIINSLININTKNFQVKKPAIKYIKELFPNAEFSLKENNIYEVSGNYQGFPISQFMQQFLKYNEIFLLPQQIYSLDLKDVLEWFQYFNLNRTFFHPMVISQLQLLFNSYNLIPQDKIIRQEFLYTGNVYNFSCQNQHNVISEMIVGDGFYDND